MSRRDDGYDDEPAPRSLWSKIVAVSSWFVTLAMVGLVAVFLLIVETQRPGPTGPGGDQASTIVIPRGVGVSAIGEHLRAENVIRSSLTFRAGVMLYGRGRSLKAGEYSIPPHESLAGVIERLAAGRTVLHSITAPEGWTSEMVMDLVAAEDVLEGEMPATPAEGSLLPETYNVERGETREAVVKQMQNAMSETLNELWAKRADNLPLRTPQQALVLASIVEKETGIASERPRVAAVFINRLRKGMRLESDPTIIYGVSKGRPLGRGILLSELNKETPYNTYKIYGLPPTPIANPGREALAAVLNPPASNDLYFVADGTGGHAFAATLADHQRNVARWRAIEKARGT